MPEIIYEYEVFIEVNTTDADELKNILNGLTFPVQISPHINVSDLNITTGINLYSRLTKYNQTVISMTGMN